ncbi:hypothetical protein AZO1586I_406 [Bathymodiolus thermophilus thioautotrophic gill symbiont]|uniref:Porin domain-containing protein n=1 Tax=Bathymodiolus thermophilus thioautotrophic gill symbiont TaxID=2360 RepID=A0ABM8M5S0_9GAMM|nr:hypothetical protein [Bathymodiolus thermophilus thioautotrophic gill symbiont]CAB5498893.1 hypothetical protein AZO1586I_406 [Bathymodiolus thermophilus thioautotrophic gill symbiont]
MKKLIVAAVAATMASASMADISIKGDAYIQYADRGIGNNGSTTVNTKRVNLNVIGKSGATTVVSSFRTDDNDANRSGASNLHQFYITTKVGPINVKAGDFYSTIGLGAWSKGEKSTDALSLSTKVGPVTLGVYTTTGGEVDNLTTTTTPATNTTPAVIVFHPGTKHIASTTHVSIAADIAGAKIKVINNPKAKWTNLSAKGTFGGISVAAEHHKQKAVGTNAEEKVTLLHVGGKVGTVKWDVAQYKNKDAAAGSNAKFSPLGSMLVGTKARGITATAAADTGQFSKILGASISTKVAGSTIKAIYTKNTHGAADKLTGVELIFTRAVIGGKLIANLAKISGSDTDIHNATNRGVRFDVKF